MPGRSAAVADYWKGVPRTSTLDARITELQDQDDMPGQRCLDDIVRKTAGSFPATLSAAEVKRIGDNYAGRCSKL